MTEKIEEDYLIHFNNVKHVIENKKSIQKYYEDTFIRIFNRIKGDNQIIELGSGYSIIKKFIPWAKTSDYIKLPFHDLQIDASNLKLPEKVDTFILVNTLHHIPDVERFFKQAIDNLNSNGKIIIVDQYLSFFSRTILKYLHHEPFDTETLNWELNDKNNLNDANGALAWIIFQRDRTKFNQKFPQLEIVSQAPTSGLFYWLAGGLKAWSLIPNFLINPVFFIDQKLCKYLPNIFASFQMIILEKKNLK